MKTVLVLPIGRDSKYEVLTKEVDNPLPPGTEFVYIGRSPVRTRLFPPWRHTNDLVAGIESKYGRYYDLTSDKLYVVFLNERFWAPALDFLLSQGWRTDPPPTWVFPG